MAHSGSRTVVVAALLANLLIAVAKFIASSFTHSSAMLAESFHSLADTANQGFLLLGLKLSTRPADSKHPFGYGAERYFWAFIVAISIFTVGAAFSAYEGVHKVLHFRDPEQALRHPAWGLGVLLVSLLLEAGSWVVATREFLRSKGDRPLGQHISDNRDPVLITVFLEDSAALFGLLAALAGLGLSWATGSMLYDGLASIIVGGVLGLVAYFLARETKDLLIGESVPLHESERIQAIVESCPEVGHLITQRTMHLGPDDVLAALKIQFVDRLSTDEVEAAIDEVERRLRAELPHLRRIWIEPGSRTTAQLPAVTRGASAEDGS